MNWASTCCSPAARRRWRCRPGWRSSPSSAARVRARRDHQDARLLFRFPRVQEEPGRGHDPEHAEHLPHLRACNRSSTTFSPRASRPAYERHARLNAKVAAWVERNGFEFFAPEGYRSKSLTCVRNNREIDVAGADRRNSASGTHCVIDGGYGKLKGKTFRISNMGDETDETIDTLSAGWTIAWHNLAASQSDATRGFRPSSAVSEPIEIRSVADHAQVQDRFPGPGSPVSLPVHLCRDEWQERQPHCTAHHETKGARCPPRHR